MEIVSWLLSFIFLFALICVVAYQFMTLIDLEFDQINTYDASSRINRTVMPEFILQGVYCVILLIRREWFMLFLALPHLYYNFNSYKKGRHLVDVTEIFNQLHQEKKQRLFKIAYLLFKLLFSLFWLWWSIAKQ